MKKNIQSIQKWILFVLSTTQLMSPILIPFGNNSNIDGSNPQITPAGYTFAIWGLITLLAFGYGVYQVLPNRKNAVLHQAIALRLSMLYLLFSVWLLAAAREWLVVTVIVFVIMFFLAYSSFQQILQPKYILTRFEKIVLEAQVGIYLGWCTVAIFANTGAALKFYGLSDMGTTGIIWQISLLLAALANGIYGLYKTQSNYFLAATIIWAFVGIYFGLYNIPKTLVLQITVITAMILFLFAFYKFRKLPTN